MSKNNNIHSEGMTFGSRPSSRKNKDEEWAEEDFNIDPATPRRVPRKTKKENKKKK